jgi:hypothetical protein
MGMISKMSEPLRFLAFSGRLSVCLGAAPRRQRAKTKPVVGPRPHPSVSRAPTRRQFAGESKRLWRGGSGTVRVKPTPLKQEPDTRYAPA